MQQNNSKCQLHPELLGINALNSFSKHNSSSRACMFSGHLTQHLVIKGLEEKIIQSGVEQEFAKYTFSVKMPANGKIIKVIQKYPDGIDRDSLPFNPETLVIYENEDTREIDCFTIPYYASYHQFFGFKYEHTDHIAKIRPGAYIAKGTKFSDTPAVSEDGSYMYGTNLNTAFMSMPSVSEDGVMVSRDILDKLSFKVYERRSVSFGSTMFPLNIYGTKDEYKPFPEIGSYLDETRQDGILMMLRNYQLSSSPIDLSIYDTKECDFLFDRAVYVRGGHGRVVDIEVIRNHDTRSQLPQEMCGFMNKYHLALTRYYEEIIATDKQLRSESKRKYGEYHIKLSPKLHNLVVKAMAITNHPLPKETKPLNLQYRKTPLDEYMVDFVVEYDIVPSIGFKITDSHGGQPF